MPAENSTTPRSSMRSMTEAPAGCTLDFLTESSICPSSTLRGTRTSDVAHAADQDEPRIERENLEDDTLSGKGTVSWQARTRHFSVHVICCNASNFMDDR
jgi:hypothetical protein